MALGFENISFLEKIYDQYSKDPKSLDPAWQDFFSSFKEGSVAVAASSGNLLQALQVENMIEAYRKFGHLFTQLNPISSEEKKLPKELELQNFGFTKEDLNTPFLAIGLSLENPIPLKEILQRLQATYCGRIGFEYKGFLPLDLERWIQKEIDASQDFQIGIEEKKMILEYLNQSELFEVFVHTKYTGQKRFSLEGAETLIPMLEAGIQAGSQRGAQEFVIGMAHRGRLNVLCNIMKKSYSQVFFEFEEGYISPSFEGSDDVKYHKGFSGEAVVANGKKVKVTLASNPSHLESVNPVVEGMVFAKQEGDKSKVVPFLIHGDAALSGQGVVYETLQLSKLEGYSTGGTVHFVINNHIGFTTSPKDLKSTTYCTDIAKTFSAPVFHVNAEDPEACVMITNLAMKIRQEFQTDVFIDLNCYRKYGHNETDEPAYTQPIEVSLIRKKKPIREMYRDMLIQEGIVERKIAESLEEEFKKGLQQALEMAKEPLRQETSSNSKSSKQVVNPVATAVSFSLLKECAEKMCTIPENFSIHPKLKTLLKSRSQMDKMDWGEAETLAYATLLSEGVSIRLSGQDSGRGTFSHRHALWTDQQNGKTYSPLQHLKEGQGTFEVRNSPLSEFAALGFEFGYSTWKKQALTIWEAQFGDFANGAQIVIDQYIATSEQKWGQQTGLVLMLPHGYEGQGPEHSSARIERFLTLCGHDNMQIVYPTTPSQMFHVLRRQILENRLRPLILFTPKGLLRHPECVSSLKDFTDGKFLEIIEDGKDPQKVKTLVLCTGKLYYEFLALKDKETLSFLRIEELYPFPEELLKEKLERYTSLERCLFVQEEPINMGAFGYLEPLLMKLLNKKCFLEYVGRKRSAATATGSFAIHKRELDAILNEVMRGN